MATKKMLEFHEVKAKTSDGVVPGRARYLMIADVHRIDALDEGSPAWSDGHRAVIVCKGRDGAVYHTVETAEELRAQIEVS